MTEQPTTPPTELELDEIDTLPAWLYQRFMAGGVGWENLDADDRAYWEHQAHAVRRAVARGGFKTASEATSALLGASHSPAGDRDGETGTEGAAGRVGDSGVALPDRLEAVLTERYTELGNPYSRMSINFQGPDGWPASKEVGPHDVAEVLRELLATPPRRTLTPNEYDAAWHAVDHATVHADPGTVLHAVLDRLGIEWQDAAGTPGSASRR